MNQNLTAQIVSMQQKQQ
jgi:Zn finger protein HypA/HybF involved in hydrogenase expression